MTTTVICVYVRGPYPYTADYVRRLERMARRWLARPFQFTVLCDVDTFREVARLIQCDPTFQARAVMIPSLVGVVPKNGVGYWAKLRVFDPILRLEGRVLFLDLDTLVVAPLDPIVDFPAAFALTEDALVHERAHLDRDRFQRRLVRRFNSSVMVWNAGAESALWRTWSPAVAERLSTDQDWIAEQAPHAVPMPLAWFPRIGHLVRDDQFASTGVPMPADAKVVLVKKPKNHEAVARWPWLAQAWGAR